MTDIVRRLMAAVSAWCTLAAGYALESVMLLGPAAMALMVVPHALIALMVVAVLVRLATGLIRRFRPGATGEAAPAPGAT